VRLNRLKKKLTATVLVLSAASAWAHEGHGADGAHAHGFDALLGVVGALLAVGLAIWLRNKR
jgi:hydrogenase/urease accessory protein HupE